MIKANITDIRKRIQGLQKFSENNNNAFIKGARDIAQNGRVSDIKRMIETCATSKQDIPFSVCIELFDSLIHKGTESDINKMGNIILEDMVQKPRDAKEMQKVLRRRITVLKNKPKTNTPEVNAVLNTLPEPISPTIESLALDLYEKMLDKSIIYENCDRVIENYNKVSKRFNLDRLFYENSRINGVKDTVIELCNEIDTYTLPSYIKFNTVIETALYGFSRNNIDYKKSDILEAAVDFFLFKEDGLEACKQILENSIFFDKDEDMGNIDIITEEEPETDEDDNEINIEESIKEFCINDNYTKDIITESTDFNEIFNKFKKEELSKTGKPENKLKSLVSKLYSKNVNNIVKDTPNFLQWLRTFFIVGVGAIPNIGTVLMIILFIADRFVILSKDREETEKMSKCFSNEIKKTKDKIKSEKNASEKEKLEEYQKTLKKAKSKIDQYYDSLLTDEEIEKKYDNMEFDDIDFDDFFGERADIYTKLLEVSEDLIDKINKNKINASVMFDIPSKLNDEDLISVATIASKYPETFFAYAYNKGIEVDLYDIKRNDVAFESSLHKSIRINALENAKEILDNENKVTINPASTIYEAYEEISLINEAYNAIEIIVESCKDNSQLLEASITNKLKMASMKLRSMFNKLKDKDRDISKSVDIKLDSVRKGVEKALTNDNRESIIKGSILPSASKLIKLGILNAGLICIGQPVIAVIAILGYLGASAKFKAKERQMIVDEIEIELKMCQKYIDIAEQKNDMKALKQLLMIQRDLERQHQRIKYKMKVDLGQKYFDTKHVE